MGIPGLTAKAARLHELRTVATFAVADVQPAAKLINHLIVRQPQFDHFSHQFADRHFRLVDVRRAAFAMIARGRSADQPVDFFAAIATGHDNWLAKSEPQWIQNIVNEQEQILLRFWRRRIVQAAPRRRLRDGQFVEREEDAKLGDHKSYTGTAA